MQVVMSLIVIFWLSWDFFVFGSTQSRVYVGNSFSWRNCVSSFFSLVFFPGDVVVNIGLVVLTVEVAQLLCEVILEFLNVLDSVVRDIMVAEMVFSKYVLVSFARVMFLVIDAGYSVE